MGLTGIVAGTVFLGEHLFGSVEPTTLETPFGKATLFIDDRRAFVPRHGADERDYVLPHRINHRANMTALQQLGISQVIAINSTGSLKEYLKPGSLVVPHDFISLSPTPTVFHHRNVHVTPQLDESLRSRLIATAEALEFNNISPSGVYWQTTGPRFETRAEIHMMAGFADIVGMTMASEAVVCCELGISYAALCSVDNYAHGIGDGPLSAGSVREAARANAGTVRKIIEHLT